MSRLRASIPLGLLGLLIVMAQCDRSHPTTDSKGDPDKGKAIFALCMGCHGPTAGGNRTMGAPRIGKRNPWYLRRQIANFRAGIRGADPKDTYGVKMPSIAATLAAQRYVEDVVAYLGTLEPEILPRTVTGGDVDEGKEIWRVCASCHGANGKGIEAVGTPRISGIPDWYVQRQLGNFKTGVRATREDDVAGRRMAAVREAMLPDDQRVLDVIAYLNTLPKE